GLAEEIIVQSAKIARGLGGRHRIEPAIQLVEQHLAAHFTLCHENHLSQHRRYTNEQSAQRAAVSVGRACAETAGGVTIRISHKQAGVMAFTLQGMSALS